MTSSNIITVRMYQNDTVPYLTINGRDIPDCLVCVQEQSTGDVYIKLGCGQFNVVPNDEQVPMERAGLQQLPPPHIRISNATLVRDEYGTYRAIMPSWWERFAAKFEHWMRRDG
jgi:hypothetical protein